MISLRAKKKKKKETTFDLNLPKKKEFIPNVTSGQVTFDWLMTT